MFTQVSFELAQSPRAQEAAHLLLNLQKDYVAQLEALSQEMNLNSQFQKSEWLRDQGTHGGGSRLGLKQSPFMQTASVNFSQVHYEDLPEKPLNAATALSLILHPQHPMAPSMHAHFSWTERKDGQGYWRMMADLNPAIPNPRDQAEFKKGLQAIAPELSESAFSQGDHYFYIPALQRHRGIVHYYLENHHSGDFQADAQLAQRLAHSALKSYLSAVKNGILNHAEIKDEWRSQQLEYHSLYFFQVLTLDRGTTSGLLVHNQNDLGILASLPSYVNLPLLKRWISEMPAPQEQLLKAICDCLAQSGQEKVEITDDIKQELAQIMRKHYQKHPEALKLQAKGHFLPPSVENHQSRSV